MKTNKFSKMIVVLLAAAMLLSLCSAAFAQTGTESSKTTEKITENRSHKRMPQKPGNERSSEEKPEERSLSREYDIDFSELPKNPTDEEIVEFFKKNFMGEGSAWKTDGEFDEDAMKEYRFNESGRPYPGHKCNPRHPYTPEQKPEAAPTEKVTEPA